jgi:hypothetical protein
MASMNFKRVAVVATLATSVVLMGGAAFAAPVCPNGIAPDPVSKAHQTARNAEADAVHQLHQLLNTVR